MSAIRLRQRLELIQQLRRGLTELAKPLQQQEEAVAAQSHGRRSSAAAAAACAPGREAWERSPALAGKRGVLPVWWQPEHDLQLARGVSRHGFGAWDVIAMDPEFCFASCARAAQVGCLSGKMAGKRVVRVEV